jgi:ubiquinone/menaquinone biosynthesis C-methylase UbiE
MDLRRTFDHQALLYDKARPHYPLDLFDKIIEVTGIKTGDHLLEIGPGTGQATQPFAARGFRITGVELGEHLAEVARHKLRHYPNIDIITGSFETAELPTNEFALVYSATAFHWIKPEVKFVKTHDLLVPGGHLAIIHTNHTSDEEGDAYHIASQPIYDRYWPPHADPPILPKASEIEPPEFDEKLFKLVHFQVFPMVIHYTADEYIELLGTYSPTLALEKTQQNAFLGEIKQLVNDRFDGTRTKHFAMSLAIVQAL